MPLIQPPLPPRPLQNPAVPVIPLPERRVQIGWTRAGRVHPPQSEAVLSCLPLLREQQPLGAYTGEQLAGLRVLAEHGALADGQPPQEWSTLPRSQRDRARGVANSLRRSDGAESVMRRGRRSVWVVAPPQWEELPRAVADLGFSVAADGYGADFAILVGRPSFPRISALMRSGTPHLAVTVRTASVRVGPVVEPSRSPCLQCLHLARADRDPDYPHLAMQLERLPAPETDRVMTDQAALLAARLASLHLDPPGPRDQAGTDREALLGRYWTVDSGSPEVRATAIGRHPLCDCWWEPFAATG